MCVSARLRRVFGAILLALGSAALCSALAFADSSGWTCWGPGLPDPCRNDLHSVAIVPGTDGREVWAAGAGGTLLHWDGHAWTKIPSPTSQTLRAVAFARSGFGLAVGHGGTTLKWNGSAWAALDSKTTNWFRAVAFVPGSNGSNGWAAADMAGVGSFRHWNGSGWESYYAGSPQFFGGTVYGLALLSATDGWAVGAAFRSSVGGYAGQALRWNGSRWNAATVPDEDLFAVDAVTASDAWAVGELGILLHWDGVSWAKWPASPTTNDLRGIDLLSASEGWAVGEGGVILRWSGGAWSSCSSPVSLDLLSVAAASPNSAWAVGQGGAILHWNGSRWDVVAAPEITRLEDVGFTPGSNGYDGWAVGNSKTMLHWDGISWRPVQGLYNAYYAVAMVSSRDGWLAGLGARFGRWNGTGWVDAGKWQSAMDIAMLSGADGWAAGWGKIQHWDGLTWSLVDAPTTKTLYGLDAVGPSDIWAVGSTGTIVHYDGGSWSLASSPVSDWLVDVSLASASDGWAVGQPGVFLRWNGTNWSKVDNKLSSTTLRGVSVVSTPAGTLGWVVGHGGEIYRLRNGAWTAIDRITDNDLWAVQMVSRYEAWAVGENGVLLRWLDPSRPKPPARAWLPLALR